jgi:acyl CoA:acetate/3-ketoacid CoA transferase beta subunit
MSDIRREEVCIVACAEAFRGDGEILASPMGTIPMFGARLARLTFEPELAMSDGVATLTGFSVGDDQKLRQQAEGWIPYRTIFDIVWHGRRHVMMGASQLDRFGNQNISLVGSFERPKAQLIGARGAPGNTICHKTSYWIPNHSPQVLVPTVDFVCGIGNDRAAALGKAARFHHLHRVVTNLCVFDFETDDGSLRLRSLHPGVSVDEVRGATGFDISVAPDLAVSRAPTVAESALIRQTLDPGGWAARELKA